MLDKLEFDEKVSYMDRKQFFEIIMNVCDWDASGDDEKVLRPLVEYLAQQTDETIFSFAETMAELLYKDIYDLLADSFTITYLKESISALEHIYNIIPNATANYLGVSSMNIRPLQIEDDSEYVEHRRRIMKKRKREEEERKRQEEKKRIERRNERRFIKCFANLF